MAVLYSAHAQTIPNPCYNNLTLGSSYASDDSTSRFVGLACGLRKANVAGNTTNTVTLSVDEAACPGSCSGFAYSCAQVYATQKTLHGYYECKMKPSGVAGTITTCQVVNYAGGYQDIHIKFIGNDTQRASVGYQIGSVIYQAGPIDLNFDATADFNSYGFEWTSGYIKWYVNGVEKSSENGNRALPTTPNTFSISYVVEQAGVLTSDSNIYTEPNVDRTFVFTAASSVAFTNLSYTPQSSESCDGSGINPSGSNWQGYDPTACSMGDTLLVYRNDAPQTGWSNTGSSSSNFKATDFTRTGTSISWDIKPAAVLYFMYVGTIAQADYYGFEFWVNGGNSAGGQQILAQLMLSEGSMSSTVNIADILVPGVQPNNWGRAVFPFSLFGITTDVDIVGIALTVKTTTFGGAIFIDDMKFVQQYPFCANKTSAIYTDSLAKGWLDYSSPAETYTFGWTGTAYAGSAKSIRWEMYKQSQLQFHSSTDIDPAQWDGFQMFINTADATGLDIVMSVTAGPNNDNVGSTYLLRYFGGSLPPAVDGTWVSITIPFSEFGMYPGMLVNGIKLAVPNYNTYQSFLYIDNISLAKKEMTSSETPQSASAPHTTSAAAAVVLASAALYALL